MNPGKFEIWIADLNPQFGTEAGKTRPVLIVQTNALNRVHPSTLICPMTSNIKPESKILRVNINKGVAGVKEDFDVMIDQLRAIDNRRLISRIGILPLEIGELVTSNLKIVLDLYD